MFKNLLERFTPASITIADNLAAFIDHHHAQNTKPNTISWYQEMIEVFAAWCTEQGHRWPAWAERETIEAFMTHERGRGMAPATVAARFRALRAFLNWCEEAELLDGKPSALRGAPVPKVPKTQPKTATVGEYRKLMASIERDSWTDLRDRAIVAVLFTTGLRVGELAGLTLHDFNSEELQINIRDGKTGARIVPISATAAAVLTEYIKKRPAWGGVDLWLGADGSKDENVRGVYQATGVAQMLRRRCKHAGIRHLNPHAFRHGCATAMINAGADQRTVQELLGHSDSTMTRHYAKFSTHGLQDAYEKVWAEIE